MNPHTFFLSAAQANTLAKLKQESNYVPYKEILRRIHNAADNARFDITVPSNIISPEVKKSLADDWYTYWFIDDLDDDNLRISW